jgi:hypothetical protein
MVGVDMNIRMKARVWLSCRDENDKPVYIATRGNRCATAHTPLDAYRALCRAEG